MSFRLDDRTYHLTDGPNPYDAAKRLDGAFLLWFGAVGTTRVVSYRDAGYRGVEDALEEAASLISDEGWKGYFSEPDYKDAAEDEGLVLKGGTLYDADGEEVDWDSREGNEVRDNAEADMTYTEAGWLLSWEWGLDDLDHGDPLYGAGVAKWVEEHPDWIDDDDDVIIRTLQEAGASEPRIGRALAAVRAND